MSTPDPERRGAHNSLDVISAFSAANIERFKWLEATASEVLPVVDDIQLVNATLLQRGHPELVINEQAAMMPITSIWQANHKSYKPIRGAGNFGASFAIHTVTGNDLHGDIPEDFEPTPVTADELQGLIDGTFVFPNTGATYDHRDKPSFRRMLVLFPEFTKALVLNVSDPKVRDTNHPTTQAEIFLAYQLMSRLVDTSDPYVTKDGRVNELYLV